MVPVFCAATFSLQVSAGLAHRAGSGHWQPNESPKGLGSRVGCYCEEPTEQKLSAEAAEQNIKPAEPSSGCDHRAQPCEIVNTELERRGGVVKRLQRARTCDAFTWPEGHEAPWSFPGDFWAPNPWQLSSACSGCRRCGRGDAAHQRKPDLNMRRTSDTVTAKSKGAAHQRQPNLRTLLTADGPAPLPRWDQLLTATAPSNDSPAEPTAPGPAQGALQGKGRRG